MNKNLNCEPDQFVTGELIRVLSKQSKYGNMYFDCLFKMTLTGSCLRSCIYTNCRNYSHWQGLLQIGNVFENLELIERHGKIFVDADSVPVLIRKGNPEAVSSEVLRDKVRSFGKAIRKVKEELQGELF